MKLHAICQLPNIKQFWLGDANRDCTHLCVDTRKVTAGAGFYALKGQQTDGHAYVMDAWQRGANALFVQDANCFQRLCEKAKQQAKKPGQVKLQGIFLTTTSRQALGKLANQLHNAPSQKMKVLAVTGTNGKTSCVHMLSQLLTAQHTANATLGTLGFAGGNVFKGSALTTPEPCEIHAFLAAMLQQQVVWAAIEASSIGLVQQRLSGITLRAAAFTNLSPEHLDLHQNMERYFAHKLLLFTQHSPQAWVVNADDGHAKHIWQAWCDCSKPAPLFAFASQHASLQAPWLADAHMVLTAQHSGPAKGGTCWQGKLRLIRGKKGSQSQQQTQPFQLPLAGQHNVSNMLCTLSLLLATGHSLAQIAPLTQHCTSAPGRMENVACQAPFRVLVDYAHTPHALQCILLAARSMVQMSGDFKPPLANPKGTGKSRGRGKLWVVFGCGGERDPQKRPQMGTIAEQLADRVVLTSDNPRGENPVAILNAIRAGMQRPQTATQLPLREEAIAWVLTKAQAGDVVVIAGKGHESTQEINGVSRPFDDRDYVKAWLQQNPSG